MKTTCKPKTTTVELFADAAGKKLVGTLEIPDYEKQPRLIVIGETIYLNDIRYSSLSREYHAVELVHVADETDIKSVPVEELAEAA